MTGPTSGHAEVWVEIVIPTQPKGVKRRLSARSQSPSSSASEGSPQKRKKGNVKARCINTSPKGSIGIQRPPVSPTASDFVQGSSRQSSRPDTSANADILSDEELDEELVPYYHQEKDDEIPEDPNLAVPGEEPATEDDDDTVPVRLLMDFEIFEPSTGRIIPTADLLGRQCERREYCASGLVFSWASEHDEINDDDLEEEVDDEETEGSKSKPSHVHDRVKLTRITEFNIHHIPKNGDLDAYIWIRTSRAWYILGQPAAEYAPFFLPFWKMHRVTHLFLKAMLDPEKTVDLVTFRETITERDSEDELPPQIAGPQVLGRELNDRDFTAFNVRMYLISTVEELKSELEISEAPAVLALLKDFSGPRSPKVLKSKDHDHRTSQPTTFTTPIVSRVSQGLFTVKMDTARVDSKSPTLPCSSHKDSSKVHKRNPKVIEWGPEVDGSYHSVSLDGEEYTLGDVVMMVPEANFQGAHDHGRSSNHYAQTKWFCQIRSFDRKKNQFHGQWFLSGCKTVLNELSHPLALYPINDCTKDLAIAAIYRKCKMNFMGPNDIEPSDEGGRKSNDFHCGLYYLYETAEFINLPEFYRDRSLWTLGGCPSCEFAETEKGRCEPLISQDGVSFGGNAYHLHDFVYVIPPRGDPSKLLQIGQIVQLPRNKSQVLSVRFYKRHTEFERKEANTEFASPQNIGLFMDPRRLVRDTRKSAVQEVHSKRLGGLCYVQHLRQDMLGIEEWTLNIEKWVEHDDHFYFYNYIDDDGELKKLGKKFVLDACVECLDKRKSEVETKKKYLGSADKLVGMELFAGAGGLGYGMELSGFVETKYAVEFAPSAAKTFQENHKDVAVICQNTNDLLRYVVARDNNENPERLTDNLTKRPCKEMPTKGDQVDFIFGGPPCQAFSRMNHTRTDDDPRATMPCNMLSYVEHYSPKYFLLENVAGILDYTLTDTRPSAEGEEPKIKHGMVKFILRSLIALGYQVRYQLLQAAHYGVPQSRTRIIFIGAKRGLTMPEFPVPVFAFPKSSMMLPLFAAQGGEPLKMPPPSRWKSKWVGTKLGLPDFHQCAPHEMVSILDAIGDLPAFEWTNPQSRYRLKKSERKALKEREKDRAWFNEPILEVDGRSHVTSGMQGPVGHDSNAPYATPPQNRYQQWLREKQGDEAGVNDHCTNRFSEHQVEATTMVPLKAGASHREIPMVLWPEHCKPGMKQEKKTFFGRSGGDEYFKCAMTNMSPVLKQLWPLHPLQKRIYSVRELSRAQGFPDSYKFCSVEVNPSRYLNDQIKQIGNAVAVPFALALGKELGKALIADWPGAGNDVEDHNMEREVSPEV